jgi:uncharacterized metal-binding protein YceD (DUF177 family)
MSVTKLDDKQFIIPFVGLKQGKHEFTFDITDAFFETFEYSIIQKGDVRINFVLDKKDTMMVGEFQLEGQVKTACDRCNDSIEISIEGEFRLVYKFATEDEEDESIVVVFPEEYEINIKNSLLEFMNVLLPSRSIHDEGECNEEMLGYLNEYIVNPLDEDEDEDDDFDDFDDEQPDDGPVDPRWEALRNLNKK